MTEIWQDNSKLAHKAMIQKLLHEHNIKYMSTPRKGGKRGGGAAIAWKAESISVKKYNVSQLCVLNNVNICNFLFVWHVFLFT